MKTEFKNKMHRGIFSSTLVLGFFVHGDVGFWFGGLGVSFLLLLLLVLDLFKWQDNWKIWTILFHIAVSPFCRTNFPKRRFLRTPTPTTHFLST